MRPARRLVITAMACTVILVVCVAAPARAQVVSCPPNGGSGDQVTRGLYFLNYTAGNIATVTLYYITNDTAGAYNLTLTMHDNAYDGPVLGTQTVTANLPASGETAVTFNFGSAPIPAGHTVAFVQTLVSGPSATLFFDTGTCAATPCTTCPNVFETEDTTPPLSTFRRNGAGITITAAAAAEAIPTLGTLGLTLMALALCGVALFLLRRLSA